MRRVLQQIIIAAVFFSFLVIASARAQEAYLYFGHGLVGHDVSPTVNPDLPIDVAVNNTCLVKGATSDAFVGPFTLPAGTYSVAISLASTTSPCSNQPAFTGTIGLAAGESAALLLGFNSSAQLAGFFVPLDLASVPNGTTRVIFANIAQAAPLNLQFIGTGSNANAVVSVPTAVTGAAQVVALASGLYNSQLSTGGTILSGPSPVALPNQGVLLAIAVGSTSTGSFTLVGRYFTNLF